MRRRNGCVGTLIVLVVLLGLLVDTATAKLWTLQNGTDTIKIEDTVGVDASTGLPLSLGMSYWTMTGTTADRLVQQWFWYRVGPDGPQHSLAELPMTPTKTYVSTPITTPPNAGFTFTDTSGLFTVTVDYTLTGGTTTNKTANVLKRVTIKNLTTNPLEFHLYHYSDYDLRSVAATRTLPKTDFDLGAIRGNRAYQTSFTGTALSHTFDGTTLVQSVTSSPTKYDVTLASVGDELSVLEDNTILDPFEMSNVRGPVLDFYDEVAYDDTNNMMFGMQWDFSIPASGSYTFDVVDTVYPSKPLVTAASYTGTCASNGQQVTYNICYNNSSNPSLALTNGRIDYYLGQTTYVSAANGGVYDAGANKVSWVIPSIAANAAQSCVSVVGKSDNAQDSKHITEIWSDQTFPAIYSQAIPLCNHAPTIYSVAPTANLTEAVAFTYQVRATDPDANVLTYSLDTAPVGMTISASTGVVSWTPAKGQAGTYRVVVRASDGLTFTTQSFNLTVLPGNRPPVISSTPPSSATEGVLYTYQIIATDPDGDAIYYSLDANGAPAGYTLSSTGLVSYTPPVGASVTSPYTITLWVTSTGSDFSVYRVAQTYTLTVVTGQKPNNPPKITSVPILNATENVAYTYQVAASDPDGDVIGYSLVSPPSGMYINNTTGLISWVPTYAQGGNYSITVQATDVNAASATQTYALAVANVNRPPAFTSAPILSGTINTPYSYLASATDPDNDAIIAYKLTTFPAGMSINTVTGQINWTPTAAGTFAVVVTATDVNNAVGSQSFTININNPNSTNHNPVISSTAPTAAVPEGGTYMYRIVATDQDNDALTYSLGVGAPAGLILDQSGLLMWLPDYRNVGVWNVTLIVKDAKGATATQTFAITVANTLPHFTSDPTRSVDPAKPPATQGTDGGPYYYTATATDDGGAPVTLTLASGPAGMVINSQGIVAWPNPIAGTYTIKVNATDGIATVAQTYTLTVTHVNRSPVITSLPSATSINEGSTFSYTVSATDPDGDAITYSLVTGPSGMTMNAATGTITWATKAANVGSATVTVGASDGKLRVDQTITLTVKELPPVFTSSPTTTGSVSAPYTYTAVATDPGGVAVTYSFNSAPAGMTLNATSGAVSWTSPTAGSYPVSIVASDGKMTASQNFTLVISGINYPPVISTTAPTAPVNEGSLYTYDVNATDSNNDALTYTLGAGAPATMSINTSTGLITWTPVAANIGTTSVTVNVADGNGGSVSQTFSITVNNVAPIFTSTPISTWTAGVAYTYNAVASDPGGAVVTYSLTAAPTGMTINGSTGVISWASPVAGTYAITVSATDGRATATQTGTLTVNPPGTNGPPIITTAAPTTAKEAVLYSYDVNASDPNGDAITYSLVAGSPAGMTIVATTGVISWTPDYTQAGTFPIKVRATDTGNLFAEQTFTVVVENTDRLPVFTSTPVNSGMEDFPYSYQVSATDPDGDAITYSLTSAPAGMTISATGLVSWTPTHAQIGNNLVTVSAKGATLAATQTFSIQVGTYAHTPRIESSPVTSGTISLPYGYQVVATDLDAGSVLSYTLQGTATNPIPTGMSINAVTGLISWTPATAGSYPITVVATDNTGLSGSQSFTIVVGTGGNVAPVINSAAVTTGTVGKPYSYQVVATDANGNLLTYNLTTKPAGMVINSTGLITWTPSTVGSNTVTVSVSDGTAAATQSYTLTVAAPPNNPPVITSSAVTTGTATQAYSYQIVASDPEGSALIYTLTTKPAGMTISSSGLITWTPTAVGTYNVVATVSDGAATVSQSFSIIVVSPPNTAPIISSSAVTSATAGQAYAYQVVATDADGNSLTYSLTANPAGMTINSAGLVSWNPSAAGTFNVTVSVSDGMTSTIQSYSLVVVAAPNAFPTITSAAPTAAVNEGSVFTYDVNATDTDGDTLTYSLATGAPATMTINASTGVISWTPFAANVGSTSVTVNVSDGKGGTAAQTFSVTVNNVAPVFTTTPITTGTSAVAYSYTAVATDAGKATVTYTLATGAPSGMTVSAAGVVSWATPVTGSYSITVNASDGKATTTQTYTLTIGTPVPPTITSTAPTAPVNEGSVFTYDVNATDADGAVLTYSLATGAPAGMTINATTGVISWTPMAAGVGTASVTVNVSNGSATETQTFSITVNNVAPVFTSTPVANGLAGTAYTYAAVASDAGGATISYSLATGSPAGMTINAAGVVSWASPVAGTYTITVNASDGKATTPQTYTLTIAAANAVPLMITTAPTAAVNEGSAYTYDVNATDADNDVLTYSLATGAPTGMTINSSTGVISWTPMAANVGTASVTVNVSDGKGGTASQTFSITVNNVAPVFTSTPVTTGKPGTAYSYKAVAVDAGGANIIYSLGAGAPNRFRINASTGAVTWSSSVAGTYTITINASDGKATTAQTYILVISNTTNTVPTISSMAPTAAVNEGSTYTYDVNATDANGDTLTYSLGTGAPDGMTINSSTGLITWTPMAANVGTATAIVLVSDGKGGSVSQNITVTVDNVAPVFTSSPVTGATVGMAYSYTAVATDAGGAAITYSLATGAPAGMAISTAGVMSWASPVAGAYAITLNANDGRATTPQTFTLTVSAQANRAPSISSTAVTSATENAAYSYTVTATDPDAADAVTFSLPVFPAGMTINATSGTISWTPSYTQSGSQNVTVRGTDKAGLFADQSFVITVANVDRAPSITSTAPATATVGAVYSYQVVASDPDGDAITYSIANAPVGVTINQPGLITWTPSASGTFTISVTATAGSMITTQTFNVTVVAPANRAPSITSTAVTAATENAAYSYAATATDPDAGDAVTFSLPMFPAGMTVNATTGAISWTPSYTQSGSQNVTVRATDKAGLFAEQVFVITVANVDRAPGITSTPVTEATQNVAYLYQVAGSDPDGDVITYSLATGAPAGMTISSAGLISWTPSAAGTFNITAIATAAGATATQPFTITVAAAAVDNPPVITSTAPTAAVVAVPYTYQVAASDPEGKSLSYSLTTTQTGMTINTTTGLISWTPSSTQTGARSVTVRVSDGTLAATQSFTINVTANQSPVITSTAKTTATVSRPYTYQVVANDPEGRTLTYSLTTRPSGMTINSSTGLISWTPTVTGSNSVTVSVTDGVSSARTQSYTLTVVTNTAPTFTSTAVTSTVVNRPYSYQVTATDTNGDAITFSLTTRPTGMTINATTGLISWTPTATGSYSVSVSASDGGASRTQSYTLSVVNNSAPVISSAAVTSGVVNTEYTYDVNASDANNDSLTYSLTTAPADMTINASTGLINWTPMAAGSNNVTVSVTDGTATTTQSFTINVTLVANQPPVITSTAPTTATAGKLYTYQVTANDPEGTPVTYSLPTTQSGMTINSTTGLISWAPTSSQTGARSVTVRVSDGSLTVSQSFTINVAANTTPTITSTAVMTATVNRAYTYQVVATDPDGNTLTYSLTTRPSGMTINSTTGLITWTPTSTGSNSVTVSVSDGLASRTQSYTLSVISNQAPQITSSAPTLALIGQQYTYQVVATDANKDTLTYSLPTTQTGMTISSTGLITWTPTSTQTGSRSVTVRVSDGTTTTSQSFTITVRTSNAAPVITTTSLPSATAGFTYSRTLTATDSNGDTLRWSLTTAPTGMTISTSGTVSWTPTTAQRGTQTVTVAVTDILAITTKTFTLTVN